MYITAAFYLGLSENPDDIPIIIDYLETALSLDEKSYYKDDLNDLINFYKGLLEKNE